LIHLGRLSLTVSYVSRYENGNSPYSKNKIAIERFFENATIYINIDKADVIEKRANEIMKYGVKSKDAHYTFRVQLRQNVINSFHIYTGLFNIYTIQSLSMWM